MFISYFHLVYSPKWVNLSRATCIFPRQGLKHAMLLQPLPLALHNLWVDPHFFLLVFMPLRKTNQRGHYTVTHILIPWGITADWVWIETKIFKSNGFACILRLYGINIRLPVKTAMLAHVAGLGILRNMYELSLVVKSPSRVTSVVKNGRASSRRPWSLRVQNFEESTPKKEEKDKSYKWSRLFRASCLWRKGQSM